MRWGAREAGLWKKTMSSAVLAALKISKRRCQLDSLQLRTEVLAKDRDLCVVDLPDPKTCTCNQKAYFTLVLKSVQLP